MADLKDCPYGQDIKDDCKRCDYSNSYHYDSTTGKCVKSNQFCYKGKLESLRN
jgi:hypothetical protein